MNNKQLINILFFSLLIKGFFFFQSCRQPKKSKRDPENIQNLSDSIRQQERKDFVNSINVPAISLPYVSNLISKNSRDTLDFELSGTPEEPEFKIFIRGKAKDTLFLIGALGFEVYEEGDINGDGITDVGMMGAYSTSACREYDVFTFKENKIQTLYSILTHLPDREMGIDYFRRDGDRVRIIQAGGGCCQCFGLDTTYQQLNIKK